MGESNTIVSAYTLFRHLKWYCSNPSIYFHSITSVVAKLLLLKHNGKNLISSLVNIPICCKVSFTKKKSMKIRNVLTM